MALSRVKSDLIVKLDASKVVGALPALVGSNLLGVSSGGADQASRNNLALNFFEDSVRDNMDRLSLSQGWVDTFEDASDVAGEGRSVPMTKFDGTNDQLLRGADLTGIADGLEGTFSGWVNFTGNDSTLQIFLESEGGYVQVYKTAANKISVFISRIGGGGTKVWSCTSTGTYTASSGSFHIASSWNGTTGTLYINGVDALDGSETSNTGTNADYTRTNWSIGRDNTGDYKSKIEMGQIYFDTSYIDLTVAANRQKFYNSGAVDFGTNGSTPTGNQPLIYLNNPFGTFQNNLGSGGNFTENGQLVDGGYLDISDTNAVYSSESFTNSYELVDSHGKENQTTGEVGFGNHVAYNKVGQAITLASAVTVHSLGFLVRENGTTASGKYVVAEIQGVTGNFSYITGDRSSSITATTTLTQAGSGANNNVLRLVNGSFTNSEAGSFSTLSEAVAGRDIKFDFGTGKVINNAKWYTSLTTAEGDWKWQGSNDDSSWSDIGSQFTLSGTTSGALLSQLSSNTTLYRYYRMLGISGTTNSGVWRQEIEFNTMDDGAVGTNAVGDDNIIAVSDKLDPSTWGNTLTVKTFTFPEPVRLEAGDYWFGMYTDVADVSNLLLLGHGLSGTHAGNYSRRQNGTWAVTAGYDACFYLYGEKNIDLITKGSDDIGNSPAAAPDTGHMEILMTEAPVPVRQWSDLLDSDTTAVSTYSLRQIVLASQLSTSGSRIRVRLEGSGQGTGTTLDNVSIVERSGTSSAGTVIPTEILFSGSSGVTMSKNGILWSDWLEYEIDSTKSYLLIADITSAGSGNAYRRVATGGSGHYFQPLTDTYNTLDYPSGTSTLLSTRTAIFTALDVDVKPTINTDYIAEMSRDGGTTYSPATLNRLKTRVGATNKNILGGAVDFAGDPSGTDIVGRVRSVNKDKITVHGVSVNWS